MVWFSGNQWRGRSDPHVKAKICSGDIDWQRRREFFRDNPKFLSNCWEFGLADNPKTTWNCCSARNHGCVRSFSRLRGNRLKSCGAAMMSPVHGRTMKAESQAERDDLRGWHSDHRLQQRTHPCEEKKTRLPIDIFVCVDCRKNATEPQFCGGASTKIVASFRIQL